MHLPRSRCFQAASVTALFFVSACGSPGSGSAEPAPGTPATSDTPNASDVNAVAGVCPEGVAISQTAGKVIADVSVNGGAAFKAVIDTGAPTSVFRSDVVTKGQADVTVAGRTVHLDQATVSNRTIDTLRLPEIKAVIGGDVFRKFALTIDYPRERLMLDETVDEAALAACAHVEPARDWLPFTSANGLYVKGTMETTEGWLLLDTGASLGVVTESTFRALSAKSARPALGGFYTPAAAGTFWAKLTSIGGIEVAGLRVEHILARTADDHVLGSAPGGGALLGVVPSDFFGHTMVTFDYPQHRIRLAAAKNDPAKLPSQFFPAGIGLEETLDAPIHVASVLPGSSAEDENVAVGDEVLEILGHPIADVDPYSRAWALVAGTPNFKVDVKLRRGTTERVVRLVTRDLL